MEDRIKIGTSIGIGQKPKEPAPESVGAAPQPLESLIVDLTKAIRDLSRKLDGQTSYHSIVARAEISTK